MLTEPSLISHWKIISLFNLISFHNHQTISKYKLGPGPQYNTYGLKIRPNNSMALENRVTSCATTACWCGTNSIMSPSTCCDTVHQPHHRNPMSLNARRSSRGARRMATEQSFKSHPQIQGSLNFSSVPILLSILDVASFIILCKPPLSWRE